MREQNWDFYLIKAIRVCCRYTVSTGSHRWGCWSSSCIISSLLDHPKFRSKRRNRVIGITGEMLCIGSKSWGSNSENYSWLEGIRCLTASKHQQWKTYKVYRPICARANFVCHSLLVFRSSQAANVLSRFWNEWPTYSTNHPQTFLDEECLWMVTRICGKGISCDFAIEYSNAEWVNLKDLPLPKQIYKTMAWW